MKRLLHRRFWVLLVSAAAGYGAWKYAPGTELDRTAFSSVARGFANPPLIVTGHGNADSPWKLRVFSSEMKLERHQAPVIVSLGDDPERVFQNSPPSPIDMALVFKNLKRLGKTKVASAAVLAWDDPDPIGLAALEKSLDGFDSLVMASPLSRGAVASAMPPAIRRASISLAQIQGNTSALPVVNRVSIPNVIFGGEKTMVGFSILESEPSAGFYPIMARWEDRVVLAFPLLTVIQRLNLPLEGVEVRLGEYLKLGTGGPFVRIDGFGRIALPPKMIPAQAVIPAEAVIDGSEELFPKQFPDPVILRDDQSATEPATREFSQNLTTMAIAIASGEGLGPANEYSRLDPVREIMLMSLFVVAVTFICGFSWSRLGFILLACICLSSQWIAFGVGSVWLPGLAVLAVIGAAFTVSFLLGNKIPEPVPVLPPQEPDINSPSASEPPETAPVVKNTRPKSSSKKAVGSPVPATEKSKAKPPAKKAAKKSGTKKPPSPGTPRKKK